MYTIKCDDSLLYAPNLGTEYGVTAPKLTREVNKAGSVKFTLPPSNVMYDSIQKMKSVITVYDDDDLIFRGRVLDDKKNWWKMKEVYGEGELAFLNDSVVRPYEWNDVGFGLFQKFINEHNEQVDEYKRFTIGSYLFPDADAPIIRSSTGYPLTWKELNDKLLKTHGGVLSVTHEGGGNVINYTNPALTQNTQVIQFGVNLLDLEQYINAADVYTVMIPTGKDGITVESVNDGNDYIESADGISAFGRIWRHKEFSDLTTAAGVLAKGQDVLAEAIEAALTLTIKAIDLHLVNVDTERLKAGDMVRILSVPHGIDRYVQCTKTVLDLQNPDKSEYTFGVSRPGLTDLIE